MNNQGIYNSDNVGKGVFIFTESGNFISPKFWGLYEETEKPVGAAILGDRKLLVALNGSCGSLDLLDKIKKMKGQIFGSCDEVLAFRNKETTFELPPMGIAVATFCNEYACGQVGKGNWYIPTRSDYNFMYDHKKQLDVALAICGGKMIETDDWHLTSTRMAGGSNCLFDWENAINFNISEDYNFTFRPVSSYLSTIK